MHAILGNVCIACGATEALQIDHIDPETKSFNISTHWSIAWNKILVELKKCQLLCKPCHDTKSLKEISVEHGKGAHGKRNCTCELCRDAKKAYMKEYNFIRIR